MNYRCYQILLGVKHFYTNREQCKVLTAIYHWGADLAAYGRIRDNRQNVLQSSFFQQEVVAAPVFPIFSSLSITSRRPLLEI